MQGKPESELGKIAADLRHFAAREQHGLTAGFVLRMFLLTPGFQMVFTHRVQEALRHVPILGPLLRRIVWWFSCMAFGSEIGLGTTIGGGLYIPHPFGIVLGPSVLGRNVTILQNVTLGRRSRKDMGDPRIEDEAYLGAGCVILGPVTVGSHASVGANSVVLTDVPAGATAVGSPARIILARDPTENQAVASSPLPAGGALD